MEMKTAQVATLRDGKVVGAVLVVVDSGAHDGSTPMFSVPV